MPKLKSIKVLQYFIKTIISGAVMVLVGIAIIQSSIIDFLWETTWMRPAIILALSVIPILFAIDEYNSNQKVIKMLLK